MFQLLLHLQVEENGVEDFVITSLKATGLSTIYSRVNKQQIQRYNVSTCAS